MKKTMLTVVILLVVFAVGLSPAKAELIIIGIEAVVDTVSDYWGHLEGNISEGDIITGYYIYESTMEDSNPSGNGGDYFHYNPPCGIYLTVGGFEFMTDPSNTVFVVTILDDVLSNDDYYILDSYNNLPLSNDVEITDLFWQLTDSTGTAISSDALPTTAPVLSDWDHNRLYIKGGPRETNFVILATVTSAIVIPEPATLIFLAVGAAGLRRRLN